MPFWRVQYVDSSQARCLSVHRDEAIARVDVGRHLAGLAGTIRAIVPGLRRRRYGLDFPEMLDDGLLVADAIVESLSMGDEWAAYDRWHAFLARWRHVFGTPWWPEVGTVIVQGSGPSAQLPLFPFIRPVLGLAGPDPVSRRRRYKVWWEDENGRSHASFHTDEEAALAEAGNALSSILENAAFTLEVFREFVGSRHPEYLEEALASIDEAESLLESGNVRAAYERWKEFEEVDLDAGAGNGGLVGPPPLAPRIGRVRVETV